MTGIATRARSACIGLALVLAIARTIAAPTPTPAPAPPPANSSLDAPLFYQLLIGELELVEGHAGNAYEVILDAARRHGDDELYQRATDIALHAHAGDQALAAVRAWRSAKPQSIAAMRYETQILLALNRADEAAEPLAAWLAAVPVVERPGLIASVPRMLQRMPDHRQALALVERLVAPYRDAPATRTASRIAVGAARLAAGDEAIALSIARDVAADDPASAGAASLALQMLPATAGAESIVTAYLARPDADPGVRLAYVRVLIQQQRFAEELPQLEQIAQARPEVADTWLTLGAIRLELRQPREAEAALTRYLDLAKPGDDANPHAGDIDAAGESTGSPSSRGITQARLLLSQAAEMRGDFQAAETWLDQIDNPREALDVQSRRASLMMRQGKIKQAQALIEAVPERSPDDARAKLLAQAQLYRDAKLWGDAEQVLSAATKRFADDPDLLYELAMVEEKLDHFDEMERLLRRVMTLKPDHPHARNALGYSLADRDQRLPEARELILQALALSPGDPFIIDSLGWVEYRMGNPQDALRLLRQAYRARPDTEIAAHLGEVLWVTGQHDEARRIWQEARGRDTGNEVLRETLARLKVAL